MSPRTLVLLALASVGLLGLAIWEILAAGTSQRAVVAAQDEKDEPSPEDAPRQGPGTENEPRVVRDALGRAAEIQVEGADTAVDQGEEPGPREPAPGDLTGQAPSLEEARQGFDIVMEELALVSKRRRKISQKQWERHHREANDAFAALSARLRAGDEKDRVELENAHKMLKERLGRLRVRGKKHEAP